MKVLTKVALGGLINRLPETVQLFPQQKQIDYLATQFIGDGEVWDSEYIHYKHGNAVEVTQWLQSFGINKTFSSEFVIASVIELLMKFRNEGSEKFFEIDGETFKRALHTEAEETQYSDLFKLPLRGEEVISTFGSEPKFLGYAQHADLALYISRDEQDFSRFEQDIEGLRKMHLHVPYAEAHLEESLSAFVGMPCRFNSKDGVVGEAGVITVFKMDAHGAEAKQAAFLGMLSASCSMAPVERRHPRVEVIDGSYFVYITVKGRLAFAVEIEPTDFVIGNGLVEHFESSAAWVEDLRKKQTKF